MNRIVAVTGASGHLGNVICSQLIEKGFSVRAFYNSFIGSIKDLKVEAVKGSVLSKEDLSRLIEGCKVVINCAAIISVNILLNYLSSK